MRAARHVYATRSACAQAPSRKQSMGRTPAKVTSQSNSYRFTLIDPVTVLDESAKWEKIWTDLFVRR